MSLVGLIAEITLRWKISPPCSVNGVSTAKTVSINNKKTETLVSNFAYCYGWVFLRQRSLCCPSLRIFLLGVAKLDSGQVGSSRQIYTDDILVPHGSLQRINVFLLAVLLVDVPLG